MEPIGPKFLQKIDLRDMGGKASGFTGRGTISKPFQPRLAIWQRLRQLKRPGLRLFDPHRGHRADQQAGIVNDLPVGRAWHELKLAGLEWKGSDLRRM